MKVKYIGDYYKICLQKKKIYDVISVENDWFEILDETNKTAFFPPSEFEVMEK